MAITPAGKKPAPLKTTTKPATNKKAASIPAPKIYPITAREQRFVEEYLIDLNGKQAYMRAVPGTKEGSAVVLASRLLTKVHVLAAIDKAKVERSVRTNITADEALKQVWDVAIADARELVQVKVGCCRHCYGEGHRKQRTVAEMKRDREKFIDSGKAAEDFDEEGGIGFNALNPPVPICPECRGDGHARTVLMDTRNLSPRAVALYAGAKEGKHGIEVVMNDKMTALEKVFKHLGLYKEDNEQKTDALATLLHGIASGNNSSFKPVQDDPEYKKRPGK